MYCTCGNPRKSYTQIGYDLWGCACCKKPTQMVFRKLTNMRAPENAVGVLYEKAQADGRSIIGWASEDGTRIETVEFHPYPRKVGMNAGESLLFRTWELLDSKVDIIMTPDPNDDMVKASARERAKYEARGIAETLAILMQPFITSADEVVRHAVKRYKARIAGEPYVTPGLAEELWNPNTNWDGSDRTPVGKSKKVSLPALSDKTAAQIKAALNSGMFTPAQLAETFKISLAEVESCR